MYKTLNWKQNADRIIWGISLVSNVGLILSVGLRMVMFLRFKLLKIVFGWSFGWGYDWGCVWGLFFF